MEHGNASAMGNAIYVRRKNGYGNRQNYRVVLL